MFFLVRIYILVSGFDVGDLSENAADDLEGLDASAAHVANLLSTEPADSKFRNADVMAKPFLMPIYIEEVLEGEAMTP